MGGSQSLFLWVQSSHLSSSFFIEQPGKMFAITRLSSFYLILFYSTDRPGNQESMIEHGRYLGLIRIYISESVG